MRTLGQLIILVMVFVMLQACASTRVAEQLQSGKISFEDGNFKSAFHKLLPLASEGNASAEYAVGYMYYYGYGTTQDAESGLFWMNKSAEQHYEPAIEALKLIKENKISDEPTQQLSERSVKDDSDEVLHALAENKAAQPLPSQESLDDDGTAQLAQSLAASTPELADPENPAPSKQLATVKKDADYTDEHKKKYTLQLMGSYDLADLKHIQQNLHIEKKSYCALTKRDGKNWYVLGYGSYSAPYLAKLAMDDLPQNVRSMKPWVRQLDEVKVVA